MRMATFLPENSGAAVLQTGNGDGADDSPGFGNPDPGQAGAAAQIAAAPVFLADRFSASAIPALRISETSDIRGAVSRGAAEGPTPVRPSPRAGVTPLAFAATSAPAADAEAPAEICPSAGADRLARLAIEGEPDPITDHPFP